MIGHNRYEFCLTYRHIIHIFISLSPIQVRFLEIQSLFLPKASWSSSCFRIFFSSFFSFRWILWKTFLRRTTKTYFRNFQESWFTFCHLCQWSFFHSLLLVKLFFFKLKSKHEITYDICIKKSKSFEKPIEDYKLIETYGPNVVSSIGDVWKHQRMLFNPIFSQDSYLEIVCNSTVRFTNELIDLLVNKEVNEIKLK
jgi:hypothetical protein